VLILAWALRYGLAFLPVRRGYQLALLYAILIVYAVAAGLNPPIVRAVLMAAIVLSAYLVRREADFLTAIGAAAVVGLLWQPWALFTPSFQLSFAATTGLALYMPREAGSQVLEVARASVVTTLATLPILSVWFGVVSWIGPLANVLIVPAMMPLMILPIFVQPLGAFGAWVMRVVVEPIGGYLLLIVESFGQSWMAATLPEMPAWWIIVYYLAWLLAWRPHLRKA
jgi:competence protein ComEC